MARTTQEYLDEVRRNYNNSGNSSANNAAKGSTQRPNPNSVKNYNPNDYNDSGNSSANNAAVGSSQRPKPRPSNSGNSSGTTQNSGSGYVRPEPEIDPSAKYYERALKLAEQQRREAERARQAGIDSAIGQYQSQIPLLEQQKEKAAQEAYIRLQQRLRDIPQQLTAGGYGDGGLSESSRVNIDTDYGNEMNSVTAAYQNALGEINNNISQIKATGDISLAESADSYLQQMQNILLQQAQGQQALQQQRQAAAQRQSAAYSGGEKVTNNFSKLMQLYNATGDDRYLKMASDELGVATGAQPQPERTAQTPLYDRYTAENINYWKSLGYTDEQIAQSLNSSTGKWY